MPLDFNALRTLTAQGDMTLALQLLSQHLIVHGPAQARNQVLGLQGRLADHQKNLATGISTNPHTVAEVRMGLLALLDELEKAGIVTQNEAAANATPLFVVVYDSADAEQFKLLSRHLRVLVFARKIAVYDVHDSRFEAGYLEEAKSAVGNAAFVIALVSNNLFGTEWFVLIEEARLAGKKIIPVLLEPVLGYEAFELAKLRSLPAQKHTVRDFSNAEEAFTDIVREISKRLN